jgi:hypothetical protein
MNKYIGYGEERAPKVREMFSRLAERYDLVNDLMSFGLHRRWKRETVRIAFEGRPQGARLIDLCCGTGDIGFLEEERKGTRGRGLDLTLPMPRWRAAARDIARSFRQGTLSRSFPDAASMSLLLRVAHIAIRRRLWGDETRLAPTEEPSSGFWKA